MYAPRPFKIDNPEEIYSFISENNLATIISPGDDYPLASPIPLIIKKDTLIGHFARGNPQVRYLNSNPKVLVSFSGAQGYISSYAKDPENLSILPTWDYQMVHGEGLLSFVSEEQLKEILNELMQIHEIKEPKALALSDYPKDPFKQKLKGIIGFEIKISKWMACFRLNQNRTDAEREHISRHLKNKPKLVSAIKKFNS